MNKVILCIGGTPSGKAKFDELTKENCWVWNLNPKNRLGNLAKEFYWNGERNEEYYSFTSEFLQLLNKYFDYEKNHLRKKIEDFRNDVDEVKKDISGKEYNKFVLILHGISREAREMLKDEYGVLEVHISRRDLNTTPERDWVLYEDDEDFEEQIRRTVDILTKGKE